MTSTLSKHLAKLQANPKILAQSLRGIEKEGLRVDPLGRLSATPHPTALGSALTHPSITTDYSEALLELITGTHSTVDALMTELDQVHRVVATNLRDELLWNHSMPAQLPVAAIISRSKLVRCSSRWASSSLPSGTSSLSRSANSKRMASAACFMVGPGVT